MSNIDFVPTTCWRCQFIRYEKGYLRCRKSPRVLAQASAWGMGWNLDPATCPTCACKTIDPSIPDTYCYSPMVERTCDGIATAVSGVTKCPITTGSCRGYKGCSMGEQLSNCHKPLNAPIAF